MRCLCPPHEWFVTPAPPTYRYEDYPPYLEARAPIWTMGARTRYALVFHCNAHLSHYMTVFMYHLTYGISSLLLSVNGLFCSLSSWFTSSCAYHLITVTTFALTVYHSPSLSLIISFTNPFLHTCSHSYSFRTAFADLEPVLN